MSVESLIQFIWEGDVLGFLQALYVSSFGSADLFYGVVAMILSLGFYIRLRTLSVLAVAWILIGSLVIVAMPLVSGFAIFLLIMGIGSMLYMTFIHIRGT